MKPRTQIVRRRMNDNLYGFGGPGGFSWTKFIGVWAQIALLFQFGRMFDVLIEKPDTLAIVLTFLIVPELIKKMVSMKYGSGK